MTAPYSMNEDTKQKENAKRDNPAHALQDLSIVVKVRADATASHDIWPAVAAETDIEASLDFKTAAEPKCFTIWFPPLAVRTTAAVQSSDLVGG
jgi:hypothetical protein